MYNILYPYFHQFRFRAYYSTDYALCELVHSIFDSFHERKHTIAIFADSSKAFNLVDHDILIKKLQLCCVQGNYLNWFKSYLTNRKQYIESGYFCFLAPGPGHDPQDPNLALSPGPQFIFSGHGPHLYLLASPIKFFLSGLALNFCLPVLRFTVKVCYSYRVYLYMYYICLCTCFSSKLWEITVIV